ncbi:MAG: hypothetical protein E7545_02390 [Ruminococcaceae bacterium]|nr:hypothetical protein [Oscillospiraceae bacterium]
MRKILDKMFGNTKLAILIPTLVSAILYLLFIMFGVAEDKMEIIITTPIAAVFWFLGSFLVFYVQVKNRYCREGFLNFFEFSATLFFGIYSIIDAISVVISGFQSFTPTTVAGLLTYASIAWAHSKRTK